ncbi:MAG: flagellar biosynthetic protein FliO [Nitrospinae bacterium]|nr:flagellar biosynthetic protein FliO [Nitrospinota bacterium]
MRVIIGLTLTIAAVILLMTPTPVVAAVDLTRMNRLEEVTLFHEGEGARLVIRMKGPVEKVPTPSFFQKSIQLDLTGVYSVPAKKELPLDSPQLSMAGIYQRSPQQLRIRLFTRADGRTLAGRTKIAAEGNLLILSMTTPAPAAPVAAAPAPEQAPVAAPAPTNAPPAPDVEELALPVVKNDPLRSAPIAPPLAAREDWSDAKGAASGGTGEKKEQGPLAGLFVRKAEAAQSGETPGAVAKTGYLKYEKSAPPAAPDLGAASVRMVGALAVTVGLFLLGAVLFRKFSGKLSLGAPSGDALVRTLASAPLGPKQRIALVEVAGEVMALGISEDSISFLTSIDDAETADRIRRMTAPLPGAGDAALLASITGAFSGGKGKKTGAKKGLLARLFTRNARAAKPAPAAPAALFDETDADTFAGRLAAAAQKEGETYTRSSRPAPTPTREAAEPRPSRDELMRRVTGAIRGANASLKGA